MLANHRCFTRAAIAMDVYQIYSGALFCSAFLVVSSADRHATCST